MSTFTIPEWAVSQDAQAFFSGFAVITVSLITSAAKRWFSSAMSDSMSND